MLSTCQRLNYPLRLEPTIHALAGSFSADYTGGYWHFYRLGTRHTTWLAPAAERPFRLISPNGYQGDPR